MKKFRIFASSHTSYYLDIEAENINDAIEKGRMEDGGDFTEDGVGDWEVYDAQEIEDDD